MSFDSDNLEMFFRQDDDDGEGLIAEYLQDVVEDDHLIGFVEPQDNSNSNSNNNNDSAAADSPEICTAAVQDVISGEGCMKAGALGLKLTISPSLLRLLGGRLSGDGPTHHHFNHINNNNNNNTLKTSALYHSASPPPSIFDKSTLKASNFPMASIVIGQWQRFSRHEGDLTAKLYYAKRKIVWEVLDGSLKSKMEILWSEITAIRTIVMPHNQSALLEMQLDRAPLFYREADPQPRKHTVWHQSVDFTGGQASCLRKHGVRFPPGVFEQHYEKLLQCDQRLLALSREPFPTNPTLYFNSVVTNGFLMPFTLNPYNTPASLQPPPFTLTPNPFSTTGERLLYGSDIANHATTTMDLTMENTQGSTTYAPHQGNYDYNPLNYHPSTAASLTDIERHLLEEDSSANPPDDGTLQARVEMTMCSLLEQGDNNVDHFQIMDNCQIPDTTTVMQNPANDVLQPQVLYTPQVIDDWVNDALEMMIPMDDDIDSFVPPGGVADGDPMDDIIDVNSVVPAGDVADGDPLMLYDFSDI